MKRLIAIALTMSLATPVFAQQGIKIGDIYIETIEVNIVSLDVFVTDKKGNPVASLTKEDFEVYENGVLQEISNFSEIRERPQLINVPTISPVPLERIPEERSRKVIFFIDNETIHPFNRNKVFEEIRGFAGALLRPGDQAMLVSWNNGLKVQIPFTFLVSEFERNLIRLSGENTMKASRMLRRRQAEQGIRTEARMAQEPQAPVSLRDAYSNALSIARAYAEESRNEMRAKASVLTGLMSTLAGIQGKKAFIYVGEEFPLQPGIEIFQYANDIFGPLVLASRQQVVLSNAQTMAPTESIALEAVGRAANANGVTVYMMSAGGTTNLSETPVEQTTPRSTTIEFMDTMNRISSFQAIAEKTGGLAFVQTDNIRLAFDEIERDFGIYYSIGYPADQASLGEKNIEIKPGTKTTGSAIERRSSPRVPLTR